MKKLSIWFWMLLAAWCGGAAEAKTVRLFIVGNSFSQNATRYLPALAREGGHDLVIGRAEKGGHSLKQHWSYMEAYLANPEDPKGKAYGGKSLKELLDGNTWDVVTLQQYSAHSTDVETYRPYAQKLRDYIKTLQPQAQVVLHQTWAYRGDARGFGFSSVEGNQRAQSAQEMWEKSRAAYRTIAGELGTRVIPVGDAFWRVSTDPQWGYKRDEKFDFANPAPPALPDQSNSLHVGYRWQGENKLTADYNHASPAGCYLGALVWYGFLFGESPAKVSYTPAEVPANFAAYLRTVAAAVLNL